MKESKSAATIRRRVKRGGLFGSFFINKHTMPLQDPFESDEGSELLHSNCSTNEVPAFGPKVLQGILSSEKKLLWSLVVLRILNALVMQTSFVPDEFWQSTEVAHNMVFGYGYLTWEWKNGIRSYLYPLIFAVFFKFLAIFHMDSRFLVVKGPHLVQGIFAAFGDLYTYRLSVRLSGLKVAHWTLFCQLSSWFVFYTSSRTLTNSTEQVLTSLALYYYPWPGKPRKSLWKYLVLASLSVIIRPTAAVVWFPLFIWHLFCWRQMIWKVIRYSVTRGAIVLLASCIIDRIFYGEWTNVQYNFLHFNVLSGISGMYGTHPWHWYITQGLPVVLGTHTLILLVALKQSKEPIFLGTIVWSIVVYSFLSHKEFRFLSGTLPLIMHVCGSTLHALFDSTSHEKDDTSAKVKPHGRCGHTAKVSVIVILLVFNIPVALYFSLIHQRGTIDVMFYLYKEAKKELQNDATMSVLFLMPCHSTPYYSYIHRNISMYFLTCEPNLKSNSDDYLDEADRFYEDPDVWLKQRYDSGPWLISSSATDQLPTHIVMFDELYLRIPSWLRQHDFHFCDKFFHSHFPEGRSSGSVVVACRLPSPLLKSKRSS